jgi:hypothetical protein
MKASNSRSELLAKCPNTISQQDHLHKGKGLTGGHGHAGRFESWMKGDARKIKGRGGEKQWRLTREFGAENNN